MISHNQPKDFVFADLKLKKVVPINEVETLLDQTLIAEARAAKIDEGNISNMNYTITAWKVTHVNTFIRLFFMGEKIRIKLSGIMKDYKNNHLDPTIVVIHFKIPIQSKLELRLKETY